MAQRTLSYSQDFILELKDISYYISKGSISRADKFIDFVYEKLYDLILFPHLGKRIDAQTNKLVIDKNYIVLYEVKEKEIRILSIRNVNKK